MSDLQHFRDFYKEMGVKFTEHMSIREGRQYLMVAQANFHFSVPQENYLGVEYDDTGAFDPKIGTNHRRYRQEESKQR